jgi:hypothetical protein
VNFYSPKWIFSLEDYGLGDWQYKNYSSKLNLAN